MDSLWPYPAGAARGQIESLTAYLLAFVPAKLKGVYVHGSLALGCFNPAKSDIDLLVILHSPLDAVERRGIVEKLLALSLQPHPIEISFLTENQLTPWRYPTPYELHYSEDWRDLCAARLQSGATTTFVEGLQLDPDLAAHITVARARGIAWIGPDPVVMFPGVPAADYLASVTLDIESGLEAIGQNPVSGILNACRTLAYVQTGQVLSKLEGGLWVLNTCWPALHRVIQTAVDRYKTTAVSDAQFFDPADLTTFAGAMRLELLPRLRNPARRAILEQARCTPSGVEPQPRGSRLMGRGGK